MGITSEYFTIQQRFEQKYGPNTVVLIQVGTFYEIYEYDPNQDPNFQDPNIKNNDIQDHNIQADEDTIKGIGKARELSQILNMRLTSKNKNRPHNQDNPFMVGFPCIAYENHRSIILMNNYTIILVDQVGTAKGLKGDMVPRQISVITSPGTELDYTSGSQPTQTNALVSIYIEYQRISTNMDKSIIVCGMSKLDVSTGQNIINEVYSKKEDESYAIQDIYRFLSTYRPVELIIHLNKVPLGQEEYCEAYIRNELELSNYPVLFFYVNKLDPTFFNACYQEEFLQKAFNSSSYNQVKYISGTMNIIEELDLELLHYGRISYLVLLQHCHEHNERLILNLQRPQVNWSDQNKYLILTHNAINQLDLLPKGIRKKDRIDSLVSLLDLTSTEMGSRFLLKRLLCPLTQVGELKRCYAMINELIEDPEFLNMLNCKLKQVPDIERLQRKLQLGVIRPRELAKLFRGYECIRDIYIQLYQVCFNIPIQDTPDFKSKSSFRPIFMSNEDTADFNECMEEICAWFDLDVLEGINYNRKANQIKLQCNESFICVGQDEALDEILSQYQQYNGWLLAICNLLNQALAGTRGKLIEPTIKREDDNISITIFTTPTKAKLLKNATLDINICGQLEFQRNRSKVEITSDRIQQCCRALEQIWTMMEEKLLELYLQRIEAIGKRSYFVGLNRFISTLDFIKSGAQAAIKYKYFRPKITKRSSSYVKIKDLRHPISEQLIRSKYIPNDVELRPDSSLLLFGVNSTGKSSLAKAIGLAVIMAQAGLFIPGYMKYRPYSRIVTRLSGNDNLLKGQSSFIIEMSELRTILRNADSSTLVLGDELCRGTETVSGTSLTVATLELLAERKVSFIFSTHMHHLPKIEIVKQLNESGRLRIVHLTATYDPSLDQLVYDRKLEEGPGSSVYGLEVCRSLALDQKFIQRANEIRANLEDRHQFYSTQKSRYSSHIYMDACSLCGTKTNLHTHHLQEQSKADENGYIDHFHKNAEFNLLVLCQKCHQRVHQMNIEFNSKQTLEGTYLEPQVANTS